MRKKTKGRITAMAMACVMLFMGACGAQPSTGDAAQETDSRQSGESAQSESTAAESEAGAAVSEYPDYLNLKS